jgi:predicted kinase
VVLCGPAGSGKSTFAERHFRPTQVISSDWARGRICDDERDQRFSGQAFDLVYFLVGQRLSLNRLCVVDSTALATLSRRELLDLAKRFQVPTIAIILDVPLAACVERDAKRERSVGRDVIERQYQTFELAKTSIRQEGFDQVLEIRDGDLDSVAIEIVFRPVVRQSQKPASGANRRPLGPSAPDIRKNNGNGSTAPAKPSQLGSAAPPAAPGPSASTIRGGATPASAPQTSAAKPKAGSTSTPASGTDNLAESHSPRRS